MNGAQALVQMLIGYDTQVVFGLPGDTSVDFMMRSTPRQSVLHM